MHPFPQQPHQGTFPLKFTLEKVENFLGWSAVSQLLKLFVLSRSEWSSAITLDPNPNPNDSLWSKGIERSVHTEKDLSRKLLGSRILALLIRLRLCFLCFLEFPESIKLHRRTIFYLNQHQNCYFCYIVIRNGDNFGILDILVRIIKIVCIIVIKLFSKLLCLVKILLRLWVLK